MARIHQSTYRPIAARVARANGNGRNVVAYTAFTLSVGFAAAVVLGLVH